MRVGIPLSARAAMTTPALSLFLVVVIAALSTLGIAAPVLLAEGRTATVQRAAESVPQLTRWPSATTPGLPAFTDTANSDVGIWGAALRRIEAKRQAQPEPLRALLGAPRIAVMLDPQETEDRSPDRAGEVPQNKIRLVSDPGFIARSTLVSGRLPERSDPADGIEIALTESVAEQLAWPLGSTRSWGDDELRLTGIVAAANPDDGDWAFIGGSVSPTVELGPMGDRILVGAAFTHVDETAELADRSQVIKITAWMPFDIAGLTAVNAERVVGQLRLLAADPAAVPLHDNTFFDRGITFSSSLPQAIDTGIVRAGVMTAVVTVAAVGPILVALVMLALVSRLIAVRRVEPIRVLRARGASVGRLAAMLGGEGAVLGLLGAASAAVVAAVTLGRIGIGALLVPLALAAVPAIALPWGALAETKRRGRSDLGEANPGGSRSTRRSGRAVLEGAILAVTAALAVLVAAGGGTGGADPRLLGLLVLLGASGSILSLRVLPVLLRLAERRGRRRTSLASLLGPARARRDRVVRAAPVLAVVVGLGVAVFSVAFSATVSGGIVRSAEMTVGADLRIDDAYIDEAGVERVAEVDGVAATAGLHGEAAVEATVDGRTVRSRVYSVDRDEFATVQRGFAAALPLPEALADPTAGSDSVPVVASERLVELLGLDRTADPEFTIGRASVRVVGVAPSQAPFGTAEQWVIVDEANAAALGVRGNGSSRLFLAVEPGADPDAVGASAAAALGDDATFTTPALTAAGYTEDPGYGVVQGALVVASAVVAALLALAVAATLILGSSSRARMLAILRTLGHPSRAAGRLVAWEVAPALLVALPFGVGAGIGMALLVIPQLDLRGFVGGLAQPPVVLDWAALLLVLAGFVVVAAVAVVAAVTLASRLDAASAIRADDERMQ